MISPGIKKRLLELGHAKEAEPEKYRVHFSANIEAHNLINNLEEFPHAYVLACLMDRQIKAEKAWEIPYKIKTHIGSFTLDQILRKSEEFYSWLFKEHKFHRLNSEMGKIFEGVKLMMKWPVFCIFQCHARQTCLPKMQCFGSC